MKARDSDATQLERTVARAFEHAPELAPQSTDAASIENAIGRTLASVGNRPVLAPRRTPWVTYLAAATLAVGALAYAAEYRSGQPVAATPPAVSPAAVDRPASPLGANANTNEPRIAETTAVETPPAISANALPEARVEEPRRQAIRAIQAPPPPPSAEVELSAAELFAKANEARRANETSRAVGLYRELQSKFASSREASTSRVALGRLLLDREGKAEQARPLFEAYLASEPSGSLAEEARVGRALACMRLGDATAERAAWRDLLEHHPTSVHADRARQRLVVLGD
ncbi:hypothetical protein AKJ09_04866 [Labilithrix luteola]|uniref:Outer membrane lipoprotein BamD-like domain-containing protein n=1 Tax=Labilithrix luteola TaxID=1391654 RepID=A0A0K1PXH2_9BACT|nr:tetratricopeptide repeat protein [Labilithrix luteola]AKU98202.1 hypothetical protein AKJ09_04866 [Labilithrix luteola]